MNKKFYKRIKIFTRTQAYVSRTSQMHSKPSILQRETFAPNIIIHLFKSVFLFLFVFSSHGKNFFWLPPKKQEAELIREKLPRRAEPRRILYIIPRRGVPGEKFAASYIQPVKVNRVSHFYKLILSNVIFFFSSPSSSSYSSSCFSFSPLGSVWIEKWS